MNNQLKLSLLLILNNLLVIACNHTSSGDNSFSESLKSNSSLNCKNLSNKVPRRYIKTVSIVDDNLFIFSQKSSSKMDVNRFDLNTLKFLDKNSFADANSIKEYENGLLIETQESTVIMVGSEAYYVDFPSDQIRYFQRFGDSLYYLIDKGSYSELYKIDSNAKKTYFLKRFNLNYSDLRFSASDGFFNIVFLIENKKKSHFVSYAIKGSKAKISKYQIPKAEIIDWDTIHSKNALSIFMIAADDFYSDKQYLIRVGVDYTSKARLSEIKSEFDFKKYDTIKLNRAKEITYVLLESDKNDDRSLDFFEVTSGVKMLGSRKIDKNRQYIKQWKIDNAKSYFIFSSVSPLGDKYHICK